MERGGPHRAVEPGIAEGEHPAIGPDQVVALAVGGDGYTDDRGIQMGATQGSVERWAEGEHSAVSASQPIAFAGAGGYTDDGGVEVKAASRAMEGGHTKRECSAVSASQPITREVLYRWCGRRYRRCDRW